jgi:hypothetical protein
LGSVDPPVVSVHTTYMVSLQLLLETSRPNQHPLLSHTRAILAKAMPVHNAIVEGVEPPSRRRLLMTWSGRNDMCFDYFSTIYPFSLLDYRHVNYQTKWRKIVGLAQRRNLDVDGSCIVRRRRAAHPPGIVICCDGTSCRTPQRLSSCCDGHKIREKAKKSKHQKIRWVRIENTHGHLCPHRSDQRGASSSPFSSRRSWKGRREEVGGWWCDGTSTKHLLQR